MSKYFSKNNWNVCWKLILCPAEFALNKFVRITWYTGTTCAWSCISLLFVGVEEANQGYDAIELLPNDTKFL